jgi:hypothetical protein
MGWSLFSQGKYEPALTLLKAAVSGLPNGTPAWRTATWHLGAALEQSGNDAAALENYILSYKAGATDTIRRATIEQVYKRVNGSLQGLDEKLGAGSVAAAPTGPSPEPPSSPETSNSYKPASPAPTPDTTPVENVRTKPTETNTAPTSAASPSPEPTASPESTPANPITSTEDSARAAASRLRSIIKITGRVVDANKVGIENVVVVLISPSGSVLASTTDTNGNYSFTVAPSQKTYRLIPSKDGLTFSPVDRTFAGLFDDQIAIEFVGTGRP